MRNGKQQSALQIWLAGVCAMLSGVTAQPTQAAGWTVTPSISARGVYSDNIRLEPSASAKSDFVTEIGPSLSVRGEGARIKANVDYRLNLITYASESSANRTSQSLRGAGLVEVIDDFMFLDARAQVDDVAVSALSSPQPVDSTSISGNRTRTQSYFLSPFIKGTFKGNVLYELRYGYEISDANVQQYQSNHTDTVNLKLSQANAIGLLGWGFDYSSRQINYSRRADTDSESYRLSLTYPMDAQLRLSAFTGWERNNFAATASNSMRGIGVNWVPTERTQVNASIDRRYFGNSYSYQLTHRMPTSVWSIDFGRSAYSQAEQGLNTVLAGAFLPADISAALARVNDPGVRGQVITQLTRLNDPAAASAALQELVRLGFGLPVFRIDNFLTDKIVVSRRFGISAAFRGARNDLVLSYLRGETQSAVSGATSVDDLSQFTAIRTQALTASLGHPLTALTSLSAVLTINRSEGIGTNTVSSRQWLVNVGLNTKIGPRTGGALSVRHVTFDSNTRDYRENALTGTLTHAF